MNIYPTSLFPTSLLVGAAIAFVCAIPSPLNAQGRTLPNQTDTISGRDIDSRERQMRKIDADKGKQRDPKEVLVEINQDLGRLKELSENISSYLAATSSAPNYKYISETVAEIKKRSARLRTSLALPRNGKEKEDKSAAFMDAEKGELEPALEALNKLLDRFLHNPIFSEAATIDMQLAAKAARDLKDIIVLSEKLRKNAEKRHKLVRKNE